MFLWLCFGFDICLCCVYNNVMIKSFAYKETEKVYHQRFSKRLPQVIQKRALQKLMMMDSAETVDDLRVPPGNRLELLQVNRAGQYSIHINDQFRICFRADENQFYDVEIVDYHK